MSKNKTPKLKSLLKEIKIKKRNYKEPESITEEELLEKIGGYNSFGKHFYTEENDFSKTLTEIASLARLAGKHIVEAEDDWFTKVSLKRDSKKMDKLAEELEKIAEQSTSLKNDATILFEDIGNALNRYYDIKELNENERE